MGVLDRIRGRSAAPTDNPNGPDETAARTKEEGGGVMDSGPSSTDLSLEEKNEKEVMENGANVTADAPIGIQKAEAAALVWSKQTVYITYAWYVLSWVFAGNRYGFMTKHVD